MLVRNSALVFAALFVSSAASFVFQVMMGKTLSLGDFGQLSAILAIQGIFLVPAGALITLYSRNAAAVQGRGGDGMRRLYDHAIGRGALAALGMGVLVAATAPWWLRRMEIGSPSLGWLTALLIGAYFIQAPPLAFVRGLQRFSLYAAGLGGSGLLKIGLAALLIVSGITSVESAVWILVVSVLASAAVLHLVLLRGIGNGATSTPNAVSGSTVFFATAMAGLVLPMIYGNADMILVRVLMPDEVSGHYGAFSMVGKAVLLCGQVVGIALFPVVVAQGAAGGGNNPGILFRGLGLVAAAAAAAVLICFAAPGLVLGAILKESDPALVPLLGWYAVAAAAIALLALEGQYSLARHRYGFLLPGAIAAIAQVGGIIHFAGSLEAMVKFQAALFWAVFLLRAALAVHAWRTGERP